MSISEGKKVSEMTIVERMRNNLVPKGSEDLVRVFLQGNSAFFQTDFINDCISEAEKLGIMNEMGIPPSPLQVLALHVLFDSAYISNHPR